MHELRDNETFQDERLINGTRKIVHEVKCNIAARFRFRSCDKSLVQGCYLHISVHQDVIYLIYFDRMNR